MTKKPKQPLVKDQHIWIETTGMFYPTSNEKRSIEEYVVVETNKSSAYAVPVDKLLMYQSSIQQNEPSRTRHLRTRITQKNHAIQSVMLGEHQTLWLSEQAFQANIAFRANKQQALTDVQALIPKLSLKELQTILDTYQSKGR